MILPSVLFILGDVSVTGYGTRRLDTNIELIPVWDMIPRDQISTPESAGNEIQ